jgi:hypothetical protein
VIVYKTTGSLYFHCKPDEKNKLFVFSADSKSFRFIESKLLYDDYLNEEDYGRFYRICGKQYRQFYNHGYWSYRQKDGEDLELPKLFINSLIH